MRTKKLSRPRIFRSRLIAVFAALGMLFLSLGGVTLAAVSATADQALDLHCPDHASLTKIGQSDGEVTVNGQTITVTVDGGDVSFFDADGDPISVNFCIKAGTKFDVDSGATGDTGDILNRGGQEPDISYVVVYTAPPICPAGTDRAGEPAGDVPCDDTAVTPSITVVDPCGTAQDTATASSDPTKYTVTKESVTGGFKFTFTALNGFEIDGVTLIKGNTQTTVSNPHTVTFTNNAPCATTIDIPAAPTKSDPCGPGNIAWNVPSDTATLDWRLNGNVLSVHIIPSGVTFSGTNGATSHTFGTPGTDSNVPCDNGTPPPPPVNPTVVTAAVDFDNPTCLDLEGSDIDFLATEGITYTVVGTPDLGNSVTVKATPKAGYVLAAGSEDTFTHEFPSIEDLDCDEVLPTEGSDVCPNIPGNQVTVPKGMVLVGGVCDEPEVLGTETASPTPGVTPVDNGPDALPTAVDAGFGGPTSPSSGSLTTLLAQSMMGVGVLFLIAAGWLQRGRQNRGVHQF